jgi:hypothetical protein
MVDMRNRLRAGARLAERDLVGELRQVLDAPSAEAVR